jgi:cytochrome c biogenesis protein CcdA
LFDSDLPMDATALSSAPPLLALGAAFVAGLASAGSPCAIASMPLLIGFVGGAGVPRAGRAALLSGCFVLGMAIAFTVVGAALALVGTLAGPSVAGWQVAMGWLAVGIGAVLLFELRWPGRRSPDACVTTPAPRWRGAAGALAAGGLSALAFSPCATPAMLGILALIGASAAPAFGIALMFVYALGRGALLFAAGSSVRFAQWLAESVWAQRGARWIPRAAGMLLLTWGMLLIGWPEIIDRLTQAR